MELAGDKDFTEDVKLAGNRKIVDDAWSMLPPPPPKLPLVLPSIRVTWPRNVRTPVHKNYRCF